MCRVHVRQPVAALIGDHEWEGKHAESSVLRYWIGGARGYPSFECSSKFTYYVVGAAIRRI